jgi:hypothetical protein
MFYLHAFFLREFYGNSYLYMQCFQSVNEKVKHELSVHQTPKYDDIKYKPYTKESDLIIDIGYCLHTKKLIFYIYGDT